jgi:hypothetical protein
MRQKINNKTELADLFNRIVGPDVNLKKIDKWNNAVIPVNSSAAGVVYKTRNPALAKADCLEILNGVLCGM